MKRIDRMHFAWSRFPGISSLMFMSPHPCLLPSGRRDRLSLWERVGVRETKFPEQFPSQRYGDFGRQCLRPFCWITRSRHIFAAQKFPATLLSSAGLISFREIGGTKNRGRAQNGICSWRTLNWFAFMTMTELGTWMESMTELVISSGARDLTKERSALSILQRDQCFVGEVLRLRSG